MQKKKEKMAETLAHGYSSDSAKRELSNDYQQGRVKMFFKYLCVILHWVKVAAALEGLQVLLTIPTTATLSFIRDCQDNMNIHNNIYKVIMQ